MQIHSTAQTVLYNRASSISNSNSLPFLSQRYFQSTMSDATPLMQAAEGNKIGIMQALLDRGCELETVDEVNSG